MSTFRFRPSARLQRFLGRELIADANLAVVEFVKNAYDAGAKKIHLEFRLADALPTQLIIADDGAGMDAEEFERNWMHPGYSEKAADAPPGHRVRATTSGGRVPVGEKGLGRLAAGRLGERLEVFTRRRARDPWLHVDFDWSKFDDMTQMMDEVRIPFDYTVNPEEPLVTTGTIVVISGLLQDWTGKVRGRPVPGRSRTRLGRLKQDLRLLVRPFAAVDQQFEIYLDSDSFLEEDDIGTISPETATDDADYIYDFEFRTSARGDATIRRELRRSERLVEEFGGERQQRLPVVKLKDVSPHERRPESLECGPFRGRFIYTPPPAARRAKEIDAVGHGVLLYRDSVMVEPYGLDGDDWVGVSSRKAQRQGYALVQPTTFSGHVLIARGENPLLRDMSNRQGLIENEESEVFIQHVRAEFLAFEATVFDELSQRWTSREEKAAKQSEESLDLAAVRLRAVAHSLGQPLLGLGADIVGVRLVANRDDVPEEARGHLVDLADSAERHLDQARSVLGRFRDVPISVRTTVAFATLVGRAVEEVRPLASSLGVELLLAALPRRGVLVHEELVLEAIKELIRNAVEAAAGSSAPRVEVAHHEADGDPVVDIRDNGSGIPGADADVELGTLNSTKGRPGEGLATVSALVVASRGRVRIAATGPHGTHLEVYLPTRVAGVRSR
ncbi:MAG: ATP-binding protein [Actinobacteria bacterium]|nr:ATP-binding protein [Actinomycetota bacterium]